MQNKREASSPWAAPQLMRHHRAQTPAYLFWVFQRPSLKGKSRRAYTAAVKKAAAQAIDAPISAADIEIEISYAVLEKPGRRMDVDNILKPTLDALAGIAYTDDAQVRAVTSTLFDRRSKLLVAGRVELVGELFHSGEKHVILLAVYSNSRLADLGGEAAVQLRQYEAWRREFDRRTGGPTAQTPD